MCESTITVFSVPISRFRALPKICYGDNNCNLAKSVMLRTPWINDTCLIFSDRFDNWGHKCNILFDPDSCESTIFHSTSGAESINQMWNFSKSHIRFLIPESLIPFLTIRAIFIDIRACIREKYNIQDIDDMNFTNFIATEFICHCNLRRIFPIPKLSKIKSATRYSVSTLYLELFNVFENI